MSKVLQLHAVIALAFSIALSPAQALGTSASPRYHLRWRTALAPRLINLYKPQEGATPLAVERSGRLYVGGSTGLLHCLRLEDGEILWTYPTNGRIDSSPVLHDGILYFGAADGILYALHPISGRLIWQYRTEGEIQSPPVVAEGLIYLTNTAGELYALDARTGKWIWQYKREPPARITIHRSSGPYLARGVVYAGFSDGSLAALDRHDGTVIWRVDLSKGEPFGDIASTVTGMDEMILVSSYSRGVIALQARDGKIAWIHKVTGAGSPLFVPLHCGGIVYFGASSRGVFAINPSDGDLLWHRPIRKGALSDISRHGLDLVFSSTEDGIVILDGHRGKLQQRIFTGSGVSGGPTMTRNGLYFLSDGGYLYAFEKGGAVTALRRRKEDTFNYLNYLNYLETVIP